MRWKSAAVMVAAAALAAPRAVLVAAAQDRPAQPTAPPASQPARGTPAAPPRPAPNPTGEESPSGVVPTLGVTVEELRATLLDPGAPPASRLEAARRLLARQNDEARDALWQVASSPASALEARIAALRALADDPNPSPNALDTLLGLLSHESALLIDADAEALAAYKREPRVVQALSTLARDPNRAKPHRISAAKALGLIPDPAAAAALVGIVTNRDENPDVTAAAADALVEMTGLESNGRDPARWEQWQAENGNRAPADWAVAVMPARAAREDRLRRRADESAAAMAKLLDELYLAAPDKQRTLLRYLSDPSPEVRRSGARNADRVAQTVGGQISDAVRSRLVDLVGDADPGVRLDVVTALQNIVVEPDPLLAVLLPQLRIETDPAVKAAIVRRLARVPRVDQMTEVVRLLDDPAPAVVAAAADAVKRQAPRLLKQDPAAAQRAAERLRQTMRRLAGRPGALEARKTCGEAVAALKDQNNVVFARELLNNAREEPQIRAVAMNILGEFGPNAAPDIRLAVDRERRDTKLRVAGIQALARTESFEQPDWLVQRMNDPEKDVQDAAMASYLALLPKQPPEVLVNEVQRRKNNPTLLIAVLKTLVPQLQARARAAKDAGRADEAAEIGDQVAFQQQTLGMTYLRDLKPPQPASAVPYLREALDHHRSRNRGYEVTGLLAEQLIRAMLQSHQYTELAALGQELFKSAAPDDARYRQTVGSYIRDEVEGLRDAALRRTGNWEENLNLATALIDAALGMSPPLDPGYVEEIRKAQRRLEPLRRPPAPR
jgi:hypothetical protein